MFENTLIQTQIKNLKIFDLNYKSEFIKVFIISAVLILLPGCIPNKIIVQDGSTSLLDSNNYKEIEVENKYLADLVKYGTFPITKIYEKKEFCNNYLDSNACLKKVYKHCQVWEPYALPTYLNNLDIKTQKLLKENFLNRKFIQALSINILTGVKELSYDGSDLVSSYRVISKLIESKAKVYIKVSHISSGKVVVVSPKIWKKTIDLDSALYQKLDYDPEGYLISGRVSIILPNSLNSANKSKTQQSVSFPIKWTSLNGLIESNYFNTNCRYSEIVSLLSQENKEKYIKANPQNPIEIKEQQYTYKLNNGISEYLGWLSRKGRVITAKINKKLLEKQQQLRLQLQQEIQQKQMSIAQKNRLKAEKEKFRQFQLAENRKQKQLEHSKFISQKRFILKSLKAAKLQKQFKRYAKADDICNWLKGGQRYINDLWCDRQGYHKKVERSCFDLASSYDRQYQRDINDVCPVAKQYKNEFEALFDPSKKKALNGFLKDIKKINRKRNQATLIRDYPYDAQLDDIDLEEKFIQESTRISRAEMAAKPAQVNAWAKALSDGLSNMSKTMPSTQQSYRQNRAAVNAYTYKSLKTKKVTSNRRWGTPKISKSSKAKVSKLAQQERKERQVKNAKANHKRDCIAKGGKYYERTNNCQFIRQYDTAIVKDLGVNKVYQGINSQSGNYSNKPLANEPSKNVATNNDGNINIKTGVGKSSLVETKEAFALCWTWKGKSSGKEYWKCAGPTQKNPISDSSEHKALSHSGCGSYRKKFHNLRFSHPSEANLNGSKYKRYAYACGKSWKNKYQKRVLDKFNIQFPANVILRKYQCPVTASGEIKYSGCKV